MPDWVEPVARYMFEDGLPGTLRIAAGALVGSTLIGVVLGTLLTIDFRLVRTPIRLYIEFWRGLPILVTIFIIFFALPAITPRLEFDAVHGGHRSDSRSGAARRSPRPRAARSQSIPREQHEAAAALGFGWVGRHRFVILPQALRRLLPPLVAPAREHHPEHDDRPGDRRGGAAGDRRALGRASDRSPIGLGEIHALEIYGAVAVVFFLISFPLTRLAAYLEKRLI